MAVQAFPYPMNADPTQITSTAATTIGVAIPATLTYPAAGTAVNNVNVDYFILQEIAVVNTDTANSHTLNVYAVPSGGAAGATNQIATIPLAAGRSVNPGYSTVIPVGKTLQVIADAANVLTVKASGSMVTG